MQAEPHPKLATLAANLEGIVSSRALTQTQIAIDIGCDQGFVSNALNGKLRRLTPRVQKLIEYVDMRVTGFAVPRPVLDAAKAYMAGGGNPALLAESIRLLTAVRSS